MGDIDHCCIEVLMQARYLKTHLNAKFCIQIGQRFIEEENLRLADNRPANGNTLSLPSGQSLRLTLQQIVKPKNVGRLANLGINVGGFRAVHLQTEGHIVIDIHMRV